jgi:2-keto-4-pentenoate hydratase/2-oxohepta-3-ene-1,7-dioic acid hydratase in catechol pathway
MRLLTFRRDNELRVGAAREDGIVDLTALMPEATSVRRLLAEGLVGRAEEVAERAREFVAFADAPLDLPVPDPAKIICVGVNYQDRNAEYKDGSQAPKFPSLFMRTPLSFVPHGRPVVVPKESVELDYEGEIVLVIGKGGRRIKATDAHRHIGGLTIMNEGSVRDWIKHGKFNVTQGKNFDRSGAIGPWIETDLSAIDLADLRLETRINGELRQSDTTASMAFPFAAIIAYVSAFTTLLPGDLIATGTPTGAGARFDPPRWLQAGDTIEVMVEGVGTLRNAVIAEV